MCIIQQAAVSNGHIQMKLISIGLAGAITALASATFAVSASAQTAMDFYNKCGNGFTAGLLNRDFCHSYVTGLVNGVAASGHLICLPRGVSDKQLVMIAQDYMRRHPEELSDSENAVIVRSVVNKFPCSGLENSARVELQNLAAALELFKLDVGRYPSPDEGLKSLVEAPPYLKGWNGPYLRKGTALFDPWGHAFHYQVPGEHGAFDLFSYGPDLAATEHGEKPPIASWR
jgi:general secretion pathway protein G